jgi:cytochrome c oxidase subunit 4
MASKTHTGNAHHVVPLWQYAVTLVILGLLMALTIAASYWEAPSIGPISGNLLNNLIALAIATIKALLVILIFMGVKWSSNLAKLWAMAGFVWFSLMFIILFDYGTRKFEQPASARGTVEKGTVDPWRGGPETALPRDVEQGVVPLPDPNYDNMRPRQ